MRSACAFSAVAFCKLCVCSLTLNHAAPVEAPPVEARTLTAAMLHAELPASPGGEQGRAGAADAQCLPSPGMSLLLRGVPDVF